MLLTCCSCGNALFLQHHRNLAALARAHLHWRLVDEAVAEGADKLVARVARRDDPLVKVGRKIQQNTWFY